MPWQAVQLLRMTCHTGPLGGTTCGREAPLPCAVTVWATGIASRTAITAATIQVALIQTFTPIHVSPSFAFQDLINVQFSILNFHPICLMRMEN
jgi:hypothetical protein